MLVASDLKLVSGADVVPNCFLVIQIADCRERKFYFLLGSFGHVDRVERTLHTKIPSMKTSDVWIFMELF